MLKSRIRYGEFVIQERHSLVGQEFEITVNSALSAFCFSTMTARRGIRNRHTLCSPKHRSFVTQTLYSPPGEQAFKRQLQAIVALYYLCFKYSASQKLGFLPPSLVIAASVQVSGHGHSAAIASSISRSRCCLTREDTLPNHFKLPIWPIVCRRERIRYNRGNRSTYSAGG